LQLRTTLESAWIWLRDLFSAQVLGTTSARPPEGLEGGLSRAVRSAIAALSVLVGFAAAWISGESWGVVFFFPALMVAGLFGGAVIALLAYAAAVSLAYAFFSTGFDIWLFAGAAFVQTAIVTLLRQLFRESRRWGVRYRKLLSAMSSAVTVSDGEGRIARPHPELSTLIGMEWPDYAGRRWLRTVHPDDHRHFIPQGDVGKTLQRAEIRLKDPKTGEWRWHLMRAVALVGEDGKVEEWISVLSDVHERKLAGEQREVMIGEARHRLKNLITIIESLAKASRPAQKDASVESFLVRFLGRLRALSAASDLALASNYAALQIGDVARATLAPFLETDSRRLHIDGPPLDLSEGTGGALALGLNELATNAIKYGSLSVPEGRVDFTWRVTPLAEGAQVVMEWRESGGPPPAAPQKEGYGARVIRFIASREKNGSVETSYPPEGYLCRIIFTAPRQSNPLQAD